MSQLSQLRSPAAVQAAIDEFVQLGRTKFLARYGFGRSRDFLVRDPKTDTDCDSKAIAGVAYGPTRSRLRWRIAVARHPSRAIMHHHISGRGHR